MKGDRPTSDHQATDQFVAQAAVERSGLAGEFWDFLKHNKKWWMLPILLVMSVIGVFVALAAVGAAPFIYTLF